MPIFQNSRYEGLPITGIRFPDGQDRKLIHSRIPFRLSDVSRNATTYIVREGDEIDLIAANFYGDENLWWIIAEINEMFFPLDDAELPVGKELIIPSLGDLGVITQRLSDFGGGR